MWGLFIRNCFARKRKKKHTLYIFAPFDGTSKTLDKVKAAKELQGDGVIVVPERKRKIVDVRSPIDGEVVNISPFGDIIALKSDNGIQVVIKTLVTSTKVKRIGLSPFVFLGQWVNVGDQLTSLHVDYLKEEAAFKGVAIVVTSGQKIIEKMIGDVTVFDKILITGE